MPPLTPDRQEYQRQYRLKNRDAINERKRKRYQANPDKEITASRQVRHGPGSELDIAEMWSRQGGCCYLCGDSLIAGRDTHVDHDHVCCPRHRSCRLCRRGLACSACNRILGLAADDPDRLRRIADNFEPALIAARARITRKPVQDQL